MNYLFSNDVREVVNDLEPGARLCFELLASSAAILMAALDFKYLDQDLELTPAGMKIKPPVGGCRIPGFQSNLISGPQCLVDEAKFIKSQLAINCLEAIGVRGVDTQDLLLMIRKGRRKYARGRAAPLSKA